MRKKKAKLSLNYHAHDELSLTKIKLWQKRECHYNEIVKVIEFTIYKNNLQGDSLVISIKWMKDKYNLTLKFNNLAIWIPFLKVGDMLALPP